MRWKAISVALLLFFAGVVSGMMAQRLLASRAQLAEAAPPPSPGKAHMPWANQRMDFVRRLSRDLELSSEQAEEIDRIMKESQQRMRELWEPVAPKAHEEMERSRNAIDAVLTEAQRERMAELFRRRGPPGRDRSDFGRRGPDGEDREGDSPGDRSWGGRGRGESWRGPRPEGRPSGDPGKPVEDPIEEPQAPPPAD